MVSPELHYLCWGTFLFINLPWRMSGASWPRHIRAPCTPLQPSPDGASHACERQSILLPPHMFFFLCQSWHDGSIVTLTKFELTLQSLPGYPGKFSKVSTPDTGMTGYELWSGSQTCTKADTKNNQRYWTTYYSSPWIFSFDEFDRAWSCWFKPAVTSSLLLESVFSPTIVLFDWLTARSRNLPRISRRQRWESWRWYRGRRPTAALMSYPVEKRYECSGSLSLSIIDPR